MSGSKRVALALGSGGARGYAHIGVIQVLEERGYEIAGISGTSMGALVGGLHAAGRLAPYAEWVGQLNQRDVLRLLDPSFKAPGAIRGEKIMARVSELLDDITFEELDIPFTAVATDLLARKEVWFQSGRVDSAIRASVALPSFITPVMLNGRLLADGGMMNPVPIAPLSSLQADLTVAVLLSGDATAEEPSKAPATESADERPEPEWQGRLRRGLGQVLESDTVRRVTARFDSGRGDADDEDELPLVDERTELPSGLGMLDVMQLSIEAMQSVVARYRMASYPPDILIEVPRNAARTLDFHRGAEMIALGRELTDRALDGSRPPTYSRRMSPTSTSTVHLEGVYAAVLPELATAWKVDEHPAPRLLVLDEALAGELGLDAGWLRSDEGARFLVGNVPEGATPVAQLYAGHQFGQYSPRLGDGRALLLGELRDGEGRLRDLHLKGSGRTPFARGGDGLAAVGPMLREYLLSQAMHALGIPTTRSLAVTATGDSVYRDSLLPGAVLARVAASHIRVGTFQYARATGDVDLLRRLADHAIDRHHPQAKEAPNPYLALFDAVVTAQAELVARWMMVGFVHGVMNTDNMTISGESIDYGPCAFMEAFDPATVYSSIDHGGRYAYGNQPPIAEWNLARFAETLLPLLHEDQDRAVALATGSLESFRDQYAAAWTAGMHAKLGLPAGLEDAAVMDLVGELLDLMHEGPGRPHFLLPQPGPGGPGRRRAGARDVPRPRRLRRLARTLEGTGAGRRGDGPGQPGLRPAQPSGRGGAGRGHRGRPRAAAPAARSSDAAVRGASGDGALRRAGTRRLHRLPDLLRHLIPGSVTARRGRGPAWCGRPRRAGRASARPWAAHG